MSLMKHLPDAGKVVKVRSILHSMENLSNIFGFSYHTSGPFETAHFSLAVPRSPAERPSECGSTRTPQGSAHHPTQFGHDSMEFAGDASPNRIWPVELSSSLPCKPASVR